MDFENILSPEMQKRLADAKKRMNDRIAEIGEAAYLAEMEAEKKRVSDEWWRADFKRAADFLLGDKFKDCTFDNFTENANNQKAKAACVKLAQDFKPGAKGLMLIGNNGIGKNHLAAAIVNALCKKMYRCYYGSITKIKNGFYDAMYDAGVEHAIEKLMGYDLIVINDLGTENDTNFGKELMFQLMDGAYEAKKAIVVTTNLTDDELEEKYHPRILSRLIGLCDPIRYEDYDHRL